MSSLSLVWKSGRKDFSRIHTSFFESSRAAPGVKHRPRAATGSKIADGVPKAASVWDNGDGV